MATVYYQLLLSSSSAYPWRPSLPCLRPVKPYAQLPSNQSADCPTFPSSRLSSPLSRSRLRHPSLLPCPKAPPPAFPPVARIAQRSASASSLAFDLHNGQERVFHQLPSGLKMEVIRQDASPKPDFDRPPVVFLHGSYHAAWCWAVHWLPFFAARGHDCYALSFLGQGESDFPANGPGGTLQSHASDVAHFIRHKKLEPPILLGHSFGGLIVQEYLASVAEPTLRGRPSINPEAPSSACTGSEDPYPKLAAAILACSVPPTGNGPLVRRYILSKPIASIKVTLSLAAKAFAYSLSLCQETFFSKDMPSKLVQSYQKLLSTSSRVALFDLRELNASLPIRYPTVPIVPILVIGAENDFVVDLEGLQETATFYGTSPVVLPCIAHDIMLDTAWNNAAVMVSSWFNEIGL